MGQGDYLSVVGTKRIQFWKLLHSSKNLQEEQESTVEVGKHGLRCQQV